LNRVHSSLPSASNGRTILPRSSDPELRLSEPQSKINTLFLPDDDPNDACKPIAAPKGPFPTTTTSNVECDFGGRFESASLTIFASPQEIRLFFASLLLCIIKA
jgi:hypothetical protein